MTYLGPTNGPVSDAYSSRSIADLSEWPYSVQVDKDLEWKEHWRIHRWCSDNFGWNLPDVAEWRPALSGAPSYDDPLFSVWLFKRREHAVAFQMVWT